MSKKKKSLLPKVGTRYTERESLSRGSKQLSKLEEKYGKLEKMYGEALEELSEKVIDEGTERVLKNEAYAFLLSEGLVDKFIDFRETFHRSRAQEAYWKLVSQADLDGYWLED